MRILKKLAAAVAVVMAISTLAACGDDDLLLPQEASKPSAGTNPIDKNASLANEFNEEIFRSKVTSADSTAKEFISTVNTWIAENVSAGGDEKTACELKIVIKNGKATVTDLSGKNDWEARKGCPESLKERFESDYSGRTFTAAVFVDDSGYAVYSWYVRDDAGFNGDAPSFEDFKAGEYEWKAEDRVGMTRDGAIMGTCPRLFYPKSLQKPPEPFSKPEGWTNAQGLSKDEIRAAVQAADSIAKELVTTVNSWIADDVSMGGPEKNAATLSIIMENGVAEVWDLGGANEWNGTGKLQSLAERFEEEYSGRTFTAEVNVDASGYAVSVWYVPDMPHWLGTMPSAEAFEAGTVYYWKEIDGLTDENVVMGTYPKLRSGADER